MITLCPNDGELLAVASGESATADMQSHLRECSRCARVMDRFKNEVAAVQQAFIPLRNEAPPSRGSSLPPAPITRPRLFADEPASAPALTHIGKYLIVSTLGAGGQASVYRAVHPTLNVQVVIKLASRALEPGAAVSSSRLVAEGSTLCQLKHENIGRVLDLDFFENRPFLVMEYVPGRALDQYARDRMTMAPLEIAMLGAKLARALAAAHGLGIVHQDIKPQNVIIDEKGEPKLIDFGMARLNGAWSDASPQPLGGTIQYMAPEQARGEAPSITGLSDVFGLGSVLYFLVAGQAPFAGGTRDENLSRAKRGEFDHRALNKPGASPALNRIILKAMAAKPEDRFADANALAEALEALQHAARRRSVMRWLVPTIIAVAAAVALVVCWPKPAPAPPGQQMLISPDGASSIDGHLPLLTGQKVKIVGKVGRDVPAVVFWIGSDGKVFRMPAARVHDADRFDDIYSPGEARTTSIAGPAGTEFLLLLAGAELADEAKVADIQGQLNAFFAGRHLAELPATGTVMVDASGAHVRYFDGPDRSRDPGADSADACAGVSSVLTDLSTQLKTTGCFFTGIAVAHQDSSP